MQLQLFVGKTYYAYKLIWNSDYFLWHTLNRFFDEKVLVDFSIEIVFTLKTDTVINVLYFYDHIICFNLYNLHTKCKDNTVDISWIIRARGINAKFSKKISVWTFFLNFKKDWLRFSQILNMRSFYLPIVKINIIIYYSSRFCL